MSSTTCPSCDGEGTLPGVCDRCYRAASRGDSGDLDHCHQCYAAGYRCTECDGDGQITCTAEAPCRQCADCDRYANREE
jgi:DnaJ-class molecular chaperone